MSKEDDAAFSENSDGTNSKGSDVRDVISADKGPETATEFEKIDAGRHYDGVSDYANLPDLIKADHESDSIGLLSKGNSKARNRRK